MSDLVLGVFAWLSGAGCMWLYLDRRHDPPRIHPRCACGAHPITAVGLRVRSRNVIHDLERCQPRREAL